MSENKSTLSTPFPIHRLAHNYYLYSIPLITSLRATHNIPGTLIGTLPQCPQQNVFLGLPVLLSPSETRLLVQKRVAFIVDDAKAHREGWATLGKSEREKWKGFLRREGEDMTRMQIERTVGNREKAMERMDKGKRESILKKLGNKKVARDEDATPQQNASGIVKAHDDIYEDNDSDEFLFSTSDTTIPHRGSPILPNSGETASASNTTQQDVVSTGSSTPTLPFNSTLEPHYMTPTTSYPPLMPPSPPSTNPSAQHTTTTTTTTTTTNITSISQPALPPDRISHPSRVSTSTFQHPPNQSTPFLTPKSALHNHLSALSYFLLPGIRFGCHFSAYPGDPLRFHSHFLCRGYAWDGRIELMDLVGGGRLGTGVKKGFLIGGVVEDEDEDEDVDGREEGGRESRDEVDGEEVDKEGNVRCFCIEWGGM